MNIREIITEEISEYLKQMHSLKDEIRKSSEDHAMEKDMENKLKKGIKLERQKQKMYGIQAKFLKEKLSQSKETQKELSVQLNTLPTQ